MSDVERNSFLYVEKYFSGLRFASRSAKLLLDGMANGTDISASYSLITAYACSLPPTDKLQLLRGWTI